MSDSDEQIEEFDTDDEGSGAEPEPITAEFVSRPVVVKNALPPSKPIKFKGKGSEKKITINIKTDLIVEPPKIEPKSPEKKTEDVISEEKSAEVVEGEKKPGILEEDQKPMEVEKKTEPSTDAAPDYAKHLSYEGSLCVYTEPGTNRQLIWKAEENAWVSRTGENSSDDTIKAEESEGRSRGSPTPGDTDNSEMSGQESSKNGAGGKGPETAVPGGVYGFEGDTHTYTDPSDGSVYMWDREKSAWFPKVDDEFLARYQMSYGFTDPSAEKLPPEPLVKVETKAEKEQRKAEAKRKAQEPSTWFEVDEAHNTAVYITGLPLDITMEELTAIVTKYGLLARDDKAKDKIKLYRDQDGQPKGDALVTYIKVESVDLALHLLDGSQIRGHTLSVQRAKFQMKGKYDPALKPKRRKKDKDRAKKVHEKLFDWRPERMRGEPQKCERVVVIKNLFKPEDFDKEVTLLLEYQQDLRAECAKCGDVKKVVLYDRHPDGVAQVTFKEPAEAQACIQLLNGRWFAQKQISAEIWDGKSKYKIAETEAEIEERIAKWDKFLEDEDEKKEAAKKKGVEDVEVEQKTV